MKKLVAMVVALCVLLAGLPAMAYSYDEEYLEGCTTLYGSSAKKIHNIELAAAQLDGTVVYYGETFSFNEAVGPRTRELGYVDAMNGRGAKVTGGGVAQLASTLYLAVRESGDLYVEPFKAYGNKFVDWYVDDGDDAIITDYKAGHDFKFTSWYDGVIYISAWVDEDNVYCSLTFGEGTDCLSRATTPVYGSEENELNILNAAYSIAGTTLEWGDRFSFNEVVGPRTKENGYHSALNGRGVKVVGGGVAQVASTIYLAVKHLDCVSVDPVKTYGNKFVAGYVDDPADAVITDYNAGTDFSFTYWGSGMLTINLYMDYNRQLVCEISES